MPGSALEQIRQAAKLALFLDYDGTLADFARTPDDVEPDPQLISLLGALRDAVHIRIAVISGRRLSHIRALVPVPGMLLAGTYGVELQNPQGKRIDRVEFARIRPTLDTVKPQWRALIQPHRGFYLEDKAWSLALHAKNADEVQAESVLKRAEAIIVRDAHPKEIFRTLGGHKFLELAPRAANKGKTISYLLDNEGRDDLLPVYFGDDDKDEEAFGVILQHGGICVKVGAQPGETLAQARLSSPAAVRDFLKSLLPMGS